MKKWVKSKSDNNNKVVIGFKKQESLRDECDGYCTRKTRVGQKAVVQTSGTVCWGVARRRREWIGLILHPENERANTKLVRMVVLSALNLSKVLESRRVERTEDARMVQFAGASELCFARVDIARAVTGAERACLAGGETTVLNTCTQSKSSSRLASNSVPISTKRKVLSIVLDILTTDFHLFKMSFDTSWRLHCVFLVLSYVLHEAM